MDSRESSLRLVDAFESASDLAFAKRRENDSN